MDNNHGDHKSPRPGVVGPLPFMAFLWLINGGYQLLVLTNWDDPPSVCLGYMNGMKYYPVMWGLLQ